MLLGGWDILRKRGLLLIWKLRYSLKKRATKKECWFWNRLGDLRYLHAVILGLEQNFMLNLSAFLLFFCWKKKNSFLIKTLFYMLDERFLLIYLAIVQNQGKGCCWQVCMKGNVLEVALPGRLWNDLHEKEFVWRVLEMQITVDWTLLKLVLKYFANTLKAFPTGCFWSCLYETRK